MSLSLEAKGDNKCQSVLLVHECVDSLPLHLALVHNRGRLRRGKVDHFR